jgi:hypothetical protein
VICSDSTRTRQTLEAMQEARIGLEVNPLPTSNPMASYTMMDATEQSVCAPQRDTVASICSSMLSSVSTFAAVCACRTHGYTCVGTCTLLQRWMARLAHTCRCSRSTLPNWSVCSHQQPIAAFAGSACQWAVMHRACSQAYMRFCAHTTDAAQGVIAEQTAGSHARCILAMGHNKGWSEAASSFAVGAHAPGHTLCACCSMPWPCTTMRQNHHVLTAMRKYAMHCFAGRKGQAGSVHRSTVGSACSQVGMLLPCGVQLFECCVFACHALCPCNREPWC